MSDQLLDELVTGQLEDRQLTSFPPIEEYRLVRRLGQGAMGCVCLAHDTLLDREVAIKFLAGLTHSRSMRQRFLTEARAVARLTHPNVVSMYRIGEWRGHPFLVSEYVRGQSLDRLSRPLPSGRVRELGIGLSRGLAAAHSRGVLHRDLKPANAILTDDGTVKLLDFGLAKLLFPQVPALEAGHHLSTEHKSHNTIPAAQLQERTQPGDSHDDPVSDSFADTDHGHLRTGTLLESVVSVRPLDTQLGLTQAGSVLGTPLYMAPEIWRGEPATPRVDVYSLGVLLYELWVGRPPHQGNSTEELRSAVLSSTPLPLISCVSDPDPLLASVIERCLQTNPEDRYASGQELCEALEQLAPIAKTNRGFIRGLTVGTALVVLVAILGGGTYLKRYRTAHDHPKPSMALIPGGTFHMGSTDDEVEAAYLWCSRLSSDCTRDLFQREQPWRTVTISTFHLDTLEVTNEEFASWLNQLRNLSIREGRWVEDGGVLLADLYPPYSPWHGLVLRGGRIATYAGIERKPATQLTWEAARRYCDEHGKRLPTEAEWEFAARGVDGTRFPWGFEEPSCDGVTFARSTGKACVHAGDGPRDVGTSRMDRTPQGVFDLAGNASEWVMDRFDGPYSPCGDCRDPHNGDRIAPVPIRRVFRGGSWLQSAPTCRAATRSQWEEGVALRNVGFRCAMNAHKQ